MTIVLQYDKETDALIARDWGVTGLRIARESVLLVSEPPSGKCKVINIYWDPDTQKAVFEYDDTPA